MISKIFFICTNGRFLRKVIVSGRRVIGTQFVDKYLPQRCASISFLVESDDELTQHTLLIFITT